MGLGWALAAPSAAGCRMGGRAMARFAFATPGVASRQRAKPSRDCGATRSARSHSSASPSPCCSVEPGSANAACRPFRCRSRVCGRPNKNNGHRRNHTVQPSELCSDAVCSQKYRQSARVGRKTVTEIYMYISPKWKCQNQQGPGSRDHLTRDTYRSL